MEGLIFKEIQSTTTVVSRRAKSRNVFIIFANKRIASEENEKTNR